MANHNSIEYVNAAIQILHIYHLFWIVFCACILLKYLKIDSIMYVSAIKNHLDLYLLHTSAS